jgi:ribosomal protein L3
MARRLLGKKIGMAQVFVDDRAVGDQDEGRRWI